MIALAQLFLQPLSSLVTAGMQLQQVGGHLERIAYVLRASPEQDRSEGARRAAAEGAHRVRRRLVPLRRVEPVGGPPPVADDRAGPEGRARRADGLGQEHGRQARCSGSTSRRRARCASTASRCTELDLRTVREQCGVVMQEPTVFNGSIRRNISYNDPSLPMEDVIRAAKLAVAARRRRADADGLRDADRRGRLGAVGRPAPAAGDRARAGARPAHPRARRGDERAGQRHRERRRRAPRGQRRLVARHRAPAVDRAGRRPDARRSTTARSSSAARTTSSSTATASTRGSSPTSSSRARSGPQT